MKQYIKNLDENKLKEAFKIKTAYENGDIDLDMAKAQMKAHVGTLSAAELAYIEQKMQIMVEDECMREDLQCMMAIYDDVFTDAPLQKLLNGHPIKNYLLENEVVRKIVLKIEKAINGKYIKNEWDILFEQLEKFKIHFSRKQNQLYSELERKGFTRPTETMWLYDNLVRDQISALHRQIEGDFDKDKLLADFIEFKANILDLMEKEDTILYPTSIEMINDKEFYEMISGDEEIGYCLITPGNEFSQMMQEKMAADAAKKADKGYGNNVVGKEDNCIKNSANAIHNLNGQKNTTSKLQEGTQNAFLGELQDLLAKYDMVAKPKDEKLKVSEGLMTLEQINLVFKHLPVDISYVDENELVAFYSDTKNRVFPRSKGVIGRDVKNCHPANSVDTVMEIINKFRSGEEDKIEFWINKGEVFIYIIYVAVRDDEGNFKGVLEMMQECGHIRSLEGSRTLLTWDSENSKINKDSTADFVNETDESKEKVNNINEGVKSESEKITETRISEEKWQKEASEMNSKITDDKKTGLQDTEINNVMIGPKTKIDDVLKAYPGFKDYLISRNEMFKMLNSPMFKVMKKFATVEIAGERTGIGVEGFKQLLSDFIADKNIS